MRERSRKPLVRKGLAGSVYAPLRSAQNRGLPDLVRPACGVLGIWCNGSTRNFDFLGIGSTPVIPVMFHSSKGQDKGFLIPRYGFESCMEHFRRFVQPEGHQSPKLKIRVQILYCLVLAEWCNGSISESDSEDISSILILAVLTT